MAYHPTPLFDAHCHPTDTPSSLASIKSMRARALIIMATRAEDQTLVAETTDKLGGCTLESLKNEQSNEEKNCERKDRKESSETETRTTPGKVVPAFGWHPWFSHLIYDDTSQSSLANPDDTDSAQAPTIPQNEAHYTSVLTPPPSPSKPEDSTFISSLPTPIPLSTLLARTRAHLTHFPTALVGEIGLDRSFRLPLPALPTSHLIPSHNEDVTPGSRNGRPLSKFRVNIDHQKRILRAQLELAGVMGRAVSVHGVQAHGIVMQALSEGWEQTPQSSRQKKKQRKQEQSLSSSSSSLENSNNSYNHHQEKKPTPPPRICLHSYSGPPDTLSLYLSPRVPSKIYMSFSECINFPTPLPPTSDPNSNSNSNSSEAVPTRDTTSSQSRCLAVIKALPDDRILIESDLHKAGEEMDGFLEEVVKRVCEVRGWEEEMGRKQLMRNWTSFVFGE
ncbi:MAG: hypothetical protein M1834_006003 [Cirrosporium novae-zelandiae]|nr:MAG: hypothetical protein M1834_006003 [Cirrosporium novae-zelandiae]